MADEACNDLPTNATEQYTKNLRQCMNTFNNHVYPRKLLPIVNSIF